MTRIIMSFFCAALALSAASTDPAKAAGALEKQARQRELSAEANQERVTRQRRSQQSMTNNPRPATPAQFERMLHNNPSARAHSGN